MRGGRQRLWLVMLCAAACGHGGGATPDAGGIDASPGIDAGTVNTTVTLQLLAGSTDGYGNVDGVGNQARFAYPRGIAVDSAGTVYVADTGNAALRKITPAGAVTTLATVPRTTPVTPTFGGAAVDGAGNVFVADTLREVIRKITPDGAVSVLAGTLDVTGSTDGAVASFHDPAGVALDGQGNVYVADTGNNTIRAITPAGVTSTLAGAAGIPGTADGPFASARFSGPSAIAVDAGGNLFVADSGNNTIRELAPAGTVATIAGTPGSAGSTDGPAAGAQFANPTGVAVDAAGNVYIADHNNHAVRKLTPAGAVSTLAGAAAHLDHPSAVAVDPAGNVYVADTDNNEIRKITADGTITTLAGTIGLLATSDSAAIEESFGFPYGLAVDATGTIYLSDLGTTTLRRIFSTGVVTPLADKTTFAAPEGVALGANGLLYVVDEGNELIREVTTAGTVATLAGSGRTGGADGPAATASFDAPTSVAIDGAGNAYVTDSGNRAIRKIAPGGTVTTLASASTGARFLEPSGIAVDSAGTLYVADVGMATIDKITPDGTVTTFAGTPLEVGSADGTGADARFALPMGVTVDAAGNVYVTDAGNATIRKITPAGVTTTIAGTAGAFGITPGLSPHFLSPRALAIVGDSLVITDTNAVLLLQHIIH